MFSYEERLKAVKLLPQYDMSYSTVIRELGYPSKESLRNWYYEYRKEGELHRDLVRNTKYSEEQKQIAVDYYIEHGKCVSGTVKKLGYPSRPMLDKWILELKPEEKKHCRCGGYNVKYTREQKEEAVISLCTRNKPAKEVAAEYGTTRENLYNWKRQLLQEECVHSMDKKDHNKPKKTKAIAAKITKLEEQKDDLSLRVIELRTEVHRFKIERDIYEKAAEIIKKDRGINIKTLTNR